eukprot:9212427-Alexandrium_andersonii.AAC.1
MATHSWEAPPSHSWEGVSDSSDSDEDADELDLYGEAAGQELASCLVDLWTSGKLNAKQVSIISYWAARAGAQG